MWARPQTAYAKARALFEQELASILNRDLDRKLKGDVRSQARDEARRIRQQRGFEAIDRIGTLKGAARESGIPVSTLRDWHRQRASVPE